MSDVRLSRTRLKEKIEKETGNRIFSVLYKKKDGSMRKMAAIQLAKSKPQGNAVKQENGYMTVYDMGKRGFRTINLETVEKLKIRGVSYEIL